MVDLTQGIGWWVALYLVLSMLIYWSLCLLAPTKRTVKAHVILMTCWPVMTLIVLTFFLIGFLIGAVRWFR